MMEALRIADGVAVITGAASGIGTGLARRAVSLGMRVVLADVRPGPLEAFAGTLSGEVLAVPTDVTDPQSVEALAVRAWEAFGGVDLRAFVPRMLTAGRRAHIVNTASVGGFLPSPLMAPYTATKFAVVALTESLHGELAMLDAPIGVSLLAPGPVRTGIMDDPFGADVHPAVRGFVDTLRQMLSEHGLTPDELAERVFTGIVEGRYWLFPQPETIDEPLRRRTEAILARRTPLNPLPVAAAARAAADP